MNFLNYANLYLNIIKLSDRIRTDYRKEFKLKIYVPPYGTQ